MKVHRTQSSVFVGVVIAVAAVLVLLIAGQVAAQGNPQPQWGTVAPPPPPPPPPGAGSVSPAPAPPPPAPPAATPAPAKPGAAKPGAVPPPPPAPGATTAPPPAAATTALDPIKEREIIDAVVEGKRAVVALDLQTGRLQFEQAFAKCDEYQVKGKLLARVYMALGALYAGFLQAVPQGTEFMRLALTTDSTVEPERELVNETVTATFTMVRERLGIVGPARMDQGGAQGAGGFWVMKHNRIFQSKRMYPLGIYMETNPMVAVQSARLYFRLPSDQTYQVAEMQRNKSMYGLLIGCDAIALLDPDAIYYYIEVVGGDGSIIAAEGSLNAPVEIKMIDDTAFQGVQPILPGMPEPEKCNPDDAAPCPPWDLHCHDMPCDVDEDCVGGKVCREGYCTEGEGGGGEEGGGGLKAIGLSLFGGMGMGMGIVGGSDVKITDNVDNTDHYIALASGLSPSWMFVRAGLGYLFLERFELGLWARLQNISSDGMKIAGMGSKEKNGPMWGLYGTFFYFGDGKLMGPGQVVGEDGKLADKQGLRLYAKIEFNFFGATYHEVKVGYTRFPGSGSSEEISLKVQRASGMQALGIGPGLLYGVHKYLDVGAEIMYDYIGLGTETWAHNFDLAIFLRAHF